MSHKYLISTELSGRSKRVIPPLIYKGANLRELRDFLLGCDIFFDVIEEQDNRRRITTAAFYLRDEALRQ